MEPSPESQEPTVEPVPLSQAQAEGGQNGKITDSPSTDLPERKKDSKSEDKTSKKPPAADESGDKKLSNKELKLRQKAEKQAKRAAQKAIQEPPSSVQSPTTQPQTQTPKSTTGRRRSSSSKSKPTILKPADASAHPKRVSFHSAKPPNLNQSPAPSLTPQSPTKPILQLTSHLPPYPTALPTTTREIHPSILTLAVHLHRRILSGSSARCAATLLAFKHVISSYTTPPSVALPRHLTTYLSHQISFLTAARPLSVAQGNSIRWLKKLVVELDPAVRDAEAKTLLAEAIDSFVRERVLLAGEVIAKEAASQIHNGDIVLVFSKSSVVEKTLLRAHSQGKTFEVIIADAGPSFEGRNLLAALTAHHLRCTYTLLTSLAGLPRKITRCFLGASAVLGNGALYARAGTALVAMMAKSGALGVGPVPVAVCAESVKFSTRVVLDALALNELGDPDKLVEYGDDGVLTTSAAGKAGAPAAGAGGKKGKAQTNAKVEGLEQEDDKAKKAALEGWDEQQNLHLLNLVYDVTPPGFLDMVVTELGCIPPSAVSAVNGAWGEDG